MTNSCKEHVYIAYKIKQLTVPIQLPWDAITMGLPSVFSIFSIRAAINKTIETFVDVRARPRLVKWVRLMKNPSPIGDAAVSTHLLRPIPLDEVGKEVVTRPRIEDGECCTHEESDCETVSQDDGPTPPRNNGPKGEDWPRCLRRRALALALGRVGWRRHRCVQRHENGSTTTS